MIEEEEPEHAHDYDHKNPHPQKQTLFVLEVGPDDPPACLEMLSISIHKGLVPQVFLVNEMSQNEEANNGSVLAKNGVQEQKGEEVFVVVQTDTLVDPNAMVVKLFNAETAH